MLDIAKIKSRVKENRFMNFGAELVLELFVTMRYFVKGSFSQFGEDAYVSQLFERGGGKKSDIKYVDIGANHYRRSNNTYLFYKSGARGICVEADSFLCKKLKRGRKHDRVINCAVGVEDGKEVEFYVLSLSTRSSMDREVVKNLVSQGLKVKKTIKLPCISINSLLEQNQFTPDYLSIDIEGMDYLVLRSVDFNKYRIKVIVAERTEEIIENETMDEYMERNGYLVYKKTRANVIYNRRN